MKRYIVVGRPVFSRSDNDLHRISPARLCELYGVAPGDCYLFDETADGDYCRYRTEIERLQQDSQHKLTILMPRYNGDYTLPLGRGLEEVDNAQQNVIDRARDGDPIWHNQLRAWIDMMEGDRITFGLTPEEESRVAEAKDLLAKLDAKVAEEK